jgi:hypothetical protein
MQREAAPMVTITAHMSKITGIDWSYQSEHELLSCSQDKTVKVSVVAPCDTCQSSVNHVPPPPLANQIPLL